MAESIEQLRDHYAEAIVAADEPSRPRKVWEMAECAMNRHMPGLAILVGLQLQYRGHLDWAEYVLSVASRMPGVRGTALFELATTAAHQGRVSDSVGLLARLDSEEPLNAYRERIYAAQLTRLGQFKAAEERLEKAVLLDPSLTKECWADVQFYRYLERFPREEALGRCQALREALPYRSPAEVAEDVLDALREGRPYSLIRINDGEAAWLKLSLSDEADFSALYERNRREFLNVWYHNDALFLDNDFMAVAHEFNQTIATASCLGADHSHSLPGEYHIASPRGVSCCFNVTRKLEALAGSGAFGADPPRLCTPYIHQDLLHYGHLARILESQTCIGLVSCHPGLPAALAGRFGLSDVAFHQTPGEAIVTGGVEVEPYKVWHTRIGNELAHARPGMLYLVAAGMSGKWFCEMIKRAGGIALDIGSVADKWMKVPTRGPGSIIPEHVLATS